MDNIYNEMLKKLDNINIIDCFPNIRSILDKINQ
jgi:hypothetical protein